MRRVFSLEKWVFLTQNECRSKNVFVRKHLLDGLIILSQNKTTPEGGCTIFWPKADVSGTRFGNILEATELRLTVSYIL